MQSDFATTPAFETTRPRRQSVPIVFNSAHSGRNYPERFLQLTRLDRLTIRQSEDSFVDDLFSRAPFLGAPLLRACFPRAYLDVNREPYELDPAMFRDPLPENANITSPRVAAGLGTIARIVAENRPIYRTSLTWEDALMRIHGIYRPYHTCLQKLLTRTRSRFGLAILIDCHSMPGADRPGRNRGPDIILGDRFGTTCAPRLTGFVQEFFENSGLSVARNRPYAGGFITRSYGNPNHGVHALQIEIARHLYMNEKTRLKHAGFDRIHTIIERFIHALSQMNFASLNPQNLAAE